MLLLDFWPLKRIRFSCSDKKTTFIKLYRLVLEKAPLFLLSALSSLVTFVAQQNVGLIKHFPLEVRISNALISYIKYIGKTVWPQNLAVMYPHPGSITMIQTLGAALLILGFAILAVRSAKRYPYISFGYFWYLGTFIPMIGLIQAGEHAMADRHTYIPLIGLFIIFAWGFSDLSRKWHYRKSILIACSAIVLSVLTAATFFQVGYWKNSITLFEHALNVTDNNCLVHNDLAAVLADEGRLDDAVHHYRSAIRIWPEYAKAHKGLADILFTQRKDNEALLHYNNALTLQPDYLEGYSNLAQLHYARGEYQKAASYLGKALDIDSEKDWLHSNMALVLTALEKYDKAVIHFREALRLNPKDAETYFKYGTLLHKLDQRQSALATFAESIRIKPDYAEAYHKIGIIFVEEGKPAEAKRFFKRAIQLKPDLAEARKNLELTKEPGKQ